MDSTDADMMETETGTETQTPTPSPHQLTSYSGRGAEVVELLAFARQLIDHGKPSEALQAVVMALKTRGGDTAVFQALSRARELYINKLQVSAAADQLASLFAECAITEALPSKSEPSQLNTRTLSVEPDVCGTSTLAETTGREQIVLETDSNAGGTSILAETGRKQIVLDAFLDGSSFVCLQCGGLVSKHRKEKHYAYWCCQI